MTDEEIVKHYINKNDLIRDDCKDEFYKKIKEHPEKHKISKLEYDILKCRKGRDDDYCFYWDSFLLALLEKGYFKGANKDMKLKTYLDNCEEIKNEND